MTPASSTQTATTQDLIQALRREHMYAKYPRINVTKDMILDRVTQFNVQFVDMQFTDIHGTLKALTLPVHKLEDAIDHNVWFDGSSIRGFTKIQESDMILKPDLNTFAVLPWTLRGEDVTARLICDVLNPDGSPYESDPRFILRHQVEEAKKMGFTSYMGPELEFFLFKRDENGMPTLMPHDRAGYFDQNTDDALQMRRHMAFALDMMGIEIERMHHEVAPGQHEINFKYTDALQSADNALSLKFTLKAIAKNLGLHCTFMAKPIFGMNGSGMHVHQSLSAISDGKNTFHDASGVYGLSTLAQSYIAGQLLHIRAMNALMNPTVNSYKRLVVGYEAPVNVAWSQRNRSALIRIPRISPSMGAKAARLELRCPDPAANPYLAFAAMLAAGLDGIKKGLRAPAPLDQNIWQLSPKEMKKWGVKTVASNLKEAIDELEKDNVIRGALGEDTFLKYYEAKNREWEDYRTSVSSWETERYLDC